MMTLLSFLLFAAVLVSLILPWLNLAKLSRYKAEIAELNKEMELQRVQLKRLLAKQAVAKESSSSSTDHTSSKVSPPPLPTARAQTAPSIPAASNPASPEPAPNTSSPKTTPAADQPHAITAKATPPAPQERQDWFSKIAVWVGGVALLMAGFYMVKYSIDSGWLTPAVRVALTTLFGAALCVCGYFISIRARLAGNERIGQALSGAGIACLYFAAYAAVHLYGFLSARQGFGCMVTVTLLAVALSLRNGAPIAMMGLMGGFLTPWLMHTGSENTGLLFSYVFILVCGAQYLCVRREWWGLLLAATAGAYLWSAIIIIANLAGVMHNLTGSMLLVIGICGINAVWSYLSMDSAKDARAQTLIRLIRVLVWSAGFVQAVFILWITGFSTVDMGLFGALSIGALCLAVLREDNFMWATWVSFGAVAVGTLANTDPHWLNGFAWPVGIFLVFFIIGHLCNLHATRSRLWHLVSILPMIIVTPLLYLNKEVIYQSVTLSPGAWMLIAICAATLLVLASEHIRLRKQTSSPYPEQIATAQGWACFVFAFGLWIYVPDDFLAHSFAGLLISVAAYWRKRHFSHSEWVLGGLVAILTVVMLPAAGKASAYFLGETLPTIETQNHITVMAWLLTILAGIAVSVFNSEKWQPTYRIMLNCGCGIAALLGCIACYQWLDETYMPQAWTTQAIEGGLTSLLAVLAVASHQLCQRWLPKSTYATLILSALVAVRMLILHLNDVQVTHTSFFFNALFWQWGIPFLALSALAWIAREDTAQRLRQIYQAFAMIVGFIWCTLLVADYFDSAAFVDKNTSSTELYTYSVVWLLVAIGYQAIGLLQNQKVLHIGSLVLLLVTVGKVFLVDAAELEGLYRVLSFLGLGISLIGIGFFYNKVVFAREKEREQRDV